MPCLIACSQTLVVLMAVVILMTIAIHTIQEWFFTSLEKERWKYVAYKHMYIFCSYLHKPEEGSSPCNRLTDLSWRCIMYKYIKFELKHRTIIMIIVKWVLLQGGHARNFIVLCVTVLLIEIVWSTFRYTYTNKLITSARTSS